MYRNITQVEIFPERRLLQPPPWAFDLAAAPRAPWQEVGPGLRLRALFGDRFALTSVVCRQADRLSAAEFERCTAQAYRLLREQIHLDRPRHLVRVWNFIPGILTPLGELPERYMVFNAGRFSAYEEWYQDRGSFDREVATASGIGHSGSDLVIHGFAGVSPGAPVENPRQVPAYRYSSRYGPLPPCFARATRVSVASSRSPWLLVGGTASVRGEDTMYRCDLDAQCEETATNLAALVSAGLIAEGANDAASRDRAVLLGRYRHLRVYYVRAEHEQRIARWVKEHFAHADVELERADLCRAGLLVEIEGVAELATDFPKRLRDAERSDATGAARVEPLLTSRPA